MGLIDKVRDAMGWDNAAPQQSKTAMRFTDADMRWADMKARYKHVYYLMGVIAQAEKNQQPMKQIYAMVLDELDHSLDLNDELMDFTGKAYTLALEGQQSIEEVEQMRSIQRGYLQHPEQQPAPAEKPPTPERKPNISTNPNPPPQLEAIQEEPPAQIAEPKNLEEWKAQNPDAKPWKVAAAARKFKKMNGK